MEAFVSRNFRTIVLGCIISIPFILLVRISYPDSGSDDQFERLDERKLGSGVKDHSLKVKVPDIIGEYHHERDPRTSRAHMAPNNKLLHGDSRPRNTGQSVPRKSSSSKKPWTMQGLLSPAFTKPSCISRYESIHYHKAKPHKPSPYLISKLRSYEARHKRCGPNTVAYNRSIQQLESSKTHGGRSGALEGSCKYIIWVPSNGLGNRILSLASTFMFALMSDRVLLVDHLARDMADLFCEPFPNSSWLLPENFPIDDHVSREFNISYTDKGADDDDGSGRWSSSRRRQYFYLNLDRSDYFLDRTPFYCDQTAGLELRNVPWLILLSDQYYVPYFFMTEPYKDDVDLMFPEKDSVFHLLARYLFHPSNEAWGQITRFYQTYLARANERVGLQVRVFYPHLTPPRTITEQIHSCAQKEKLLPEVDETTSLEESIPSENKISKAILVASLHSDFYQNISTMYWSKPTKSGELVEVYQASHEEQQKFQDNNHDMKAWVEIYLLSLTDVLVTSAWSTFGYAAQGLSGLKSWVLVEPKDDRVPNPPCYQETSMEPCYHYPPVYDCSSKRKVDPGTILPFLKHCLDVKQGVKLVNVPYRMQLEQKV